MNLRTYLFAQNSPHVFRLVALAWSVVTATCSLSWWAIVHWNVPFHPLWIVVPTVLLARSATFLWLTHQES